MCWADRNSCSVVLLPILVFVICCVPSIADEVGAYLLADIAHIAGLVQQVTIQTPFHIALLPQQHTKHLGSRGGLIMAQRFMKKINLLYFQHRGP